MTSRTVDFRGIPFTVLEGATHPAYSFFTFDAEEKDFRERYWDIHNGDTVVDVGASYGAYALSACAAGATVHAFEPEPTVYEDLWRNVLVNGWESRCLAHNVGLWSSNVKVGMGSYAPHWPQQTITRDYDMVALDEYLPLLGGQLDWLKIDVEGAEVEALRGAMVTLMRTKPNLIIEVHTFLDPTLLPRCRAIIESIGGYTTEEVDRPPCTMLVAKQAGG